MVCRKFLKLAVRPSVYLMETQENQSNHLELTGGTDGYLIKDLSQMMGCEYELYKPDNGEWGAKDGKWTGILGMLDRGEVDMALAPMVLTEDRFNSIIQIQYTLFEYTFATNKPGYLSLYQHQGSDIRLKMKCGSGVLLLICLLPRYSGVSC